MRISKRACSCAGVSFGGDTDDGGESLVILAGGGVLLLEQDRNGVVWKDGTLKEAYHHKNVHTHYFLGVIRSSF